MSKAKKPTKAKRPSAPPAEPIPMTSEERRDAARLRRNARRRAVNAAKRGEQVILPPVGKPGPPFIVVTEAHLFQVEEAAGYGLTARMIARIVFGCTDSTLREICRRDARVADALEAGHAKAAFTVGKALYMKAKGGDVPAIRWFEMTRQNRSERIDGTLTGAGGNPILTEDVSKLDEAAKMERIKEILRLGQQRREAALNGTV